MHRVWHMVVAWGIAHSRYSYGRAHVGVGSTCGQRVWHMRHRTAATALGLGLGLRVRVRVRVRVGVGVRVRVRVWVYVRTIQFATQAHTCELPGGPYASCIGLRTNTRPTSVWGAASVCVVGQGPLGHLCNRPMHADEHATAEPARHLVRVRVRG